MAAVQCQPLPVDQVSSSRSFGGFTKVFKHLSSELKCRMNFSVYLPPHPDASEKFPVLYWLSGLTCTELNFIQKSGVQRYASENKVIIVAPDTSPRGCNIEGEEDSWDFGTGAGFYVDATEEKWQINYRMYTYITEELPKVVNAMFPVDSSRQSIFGHSMGGHGALLCYLKNPGKYRSASAFAPIANASLSKFGIKAFTGYLGTDKETWKKWDATALVNGYSGNSAEILIDQGSADEYLSDFHPQNFVEAAKKAGVKVVYREHEGYDHSYYFVASFIEDHIKHHMKHLSQK